MAFADIQLRRPLISIVVPCFNEASGIDLLYSALGDIFSRLDTLDFELICVDDGSTDDTLLRLQDLVARDARVRVLALSRNFGKEAALTAGIDAARGDAVIPFDADLQDPPSVIPLLIERWQHGAEVVLARRADRGSDSLMKRTSAHWFYRFYRQLSHVHLPDDVGDFRLLDRIAVDALKQLPERQRFMKGLFAWIGFKSETVDYVRAPRAVGISKFSGWRLWNFAIEGITSFSTAPLRVWTYLGSVGALMSMIYALLIIARTLVMGIELPGYASLMVVVLFLGSVQLISVGLLGEYIGRIYLESKQRPNYIVRKRFERADR